MGVPLGARCQLPAVILVWALAMQLQLASAGQAEPNLSRTGVGPLGCCPDAGVDTKSNPCATASYGRRRCVRVDASTHSCVCPAGFTVCNTVLTGHRGVIESPNFPDTYPGHLDCTWTIKVTRGNRVNITFTHFGTEVDDSNSTAPCSRDFLEVTESDKDEQRPEDTKLGTFCGTELPPLIASRKDHVFVRFVTNSKVAEIGFLLEWVLEGCGGELDKSSGVFTSPGNPSNYLPSVTCEWLITAPLGQSIQLSITELNLESSTGCLRDQLKVWSGSEDSGTSLGTFCHTSHRPVVLTSAGSAMTVRFVSDEANTGRGFKANYTLLPSRCGGIMASPTGVLHSHNYPLNYGANDDCTWLIQVEPAYVISLQFLDFDVEFHDNCSRDFVRVYDGNTTAAPMVLEHCGSSLPAPAQLVSTGNQMLVHFKSDSYMTGKGFKANYSMTCGARIVTDSSGLLDFHGFTNEGYWNNNCTWIIVAKQPDSRVSLTVTHLEAIKREKSDCDSMTLEMRDGDSLEAPLIGGPHCGPTAPPTVTSLGSAMTVTLYSKFGRHFDQFAATYSVSSAACGGDLTSERGSFVSPGYPVRYPADAECVWTLNASSGNRVQVSFASFDVTQSESCNDDYLEVREGDGLGRLVGVYCTDLPANITASNRLWIKFRSAPADSASSAVLPVGGGGFQAYYTLVHGNDLSGPRGQIASPIFPRGYVLEGTFDWRVTVELGSAVSIVFSEFYLATVEDCELYIAIYDGYDETATELLRACGGTLPAPVTSSANIVFIRFVTIPIPGGSRFLLDWTQVPTAQTPSSATLRQNVTGCGGTVVLAPEESQNLTSPGFPTGYAGNLDCEWLVETPPGFHVALRPSVMQLEEETTCQFESVQLFTGERNKPDWQPLRTLCLPNATKEAIHASALMRVVFHTDVSTNKAVFSAKLTSECGGWLTDPSGVIEVDGLFGNDTKFGIYGYLRPVECQWNVSVRIGRRIALKFTRLDLFREATDTPSDCGENYVVLRNGGSLDSPLLGAGKYCETTLPPAIETISNHAYIKFHGVRAQGKGFRLEYRQVSHSCGGSVRLSVDSNATSVSSPNFPQIPPAHVECEWVVMAPPDRRVTIDFVERFDLTSSPDCSKEFVEVRDGGSQGSRLLGRYCGNELPSSHDSVGNVLFLRFFTDVADPKNGFKANIRLATCGGMIRSSRGLLTSPGHPEQYPAHAHCVWRIVAPLGHVISLDLQKLDVNTRAQNCTQDEYLRIEEPLPGNDTKLMELGTYCQETGAMLRTTTNEAVITFHSGATPSPTQTHSGFRIAYNASLEGCGGHLNTPEGTFQSPGYPTGSPNIYCQWDITVPRGRRVKVTFLDFEMDPPNTETYSALLFFLLNPTPGATIDYFDNSSAPTVVRSTGNTISVAYLTYRESRSRGFKAHYTSDEPAVCGGTVDNVTTAEVITPPASLNLKSFFCEWGFSRPPEVAQTLSFKIFNGSFGNPQSSCKISDASAIIGTEYHRTPREDESREDYQSSGVLTGICDNSTMPIIVRSPYPLLTVRGMSNTFNGLDPVHFYGRVRSFPCGGVLTGPEERVTSPGFPGSYQADLECAWAVNFPSGQTIQVNITRLSLEPDPTCARDFLSVRNGPLPTSPLLGRYCANAPPVFRSQSNRLWIDFHSDSDNQGAGFEMLLTPVVDGCGGIFHADKGEIFSPGFPGRYPPNAECEWEIHAREGLQLQLSLVVRFFIEQSPGCVSDFIEAFDWVEGAWSSLGRHCGREAWPTINATGNQMRVLFRSDNANAGDGFKARWDVRCGGVITALSSGQLVSPNFPRSYYRNLNCNYTLVAPGGEIELRFEEFDLETGSDGECHNDKVTLYGFANEVTRKVTPLGTYCGTDAPPPRIFREAVTVLFETDDSSEHKGFRVRYKLFCDKE